jgi:hypothetical protein
MADPGKAKTIVTARNGNYIVTIKSGGRKAAFDVTPGGVVSDRNGAAVLSSDISVVKSALVLAGLPGMASSVQRWWDQH